MAPYFYHATTSKAAHAIEQTQFLPGKRGYAGPGIYFSTDPQSAIQHCFNGVEAKAAEVVICCSVDLGKCLLAKRKTVDKEACFAKGYNSVQIKGTDTYAVYESSRISVKEFRRLADDVCWYPSTAPSADLSATPLEIMIAAIQAAPSRSLNVTGDISQLCCKHPDLHEALRAGGRLRGFCEAHPQLTMDGHFVKLAKATPLAALEILVAAIQASPHGSLNDTSDICLLCLEHPELQDVLRAAGGLKGFCKAHPELIRNGSKVSLSNCQSQRPRVRCKDGAEHMHATVRSQAEEEWHEMLLHMHMQLEQERTRQSEMQKEEASRLRETTRKQAEETREQTQLKEGKIEKRRVSQELHMKEVQSERDQEACLQQQQQMKREEVSNQRTRLQLQQEEVPRQMPLRQEGTAQATMKRVEKLSQQNQARLKQDEMVRQQLWEARQQRQMWFESADDVQQQRQLQLKELSPWDALGLSADMSAAIRCWLVKY